MNDMRNEAVYSSYEDFIQAMVRLRFVVLVGVNLVPADRPGSHIGFHDDLNDVWHLIPTHKVKEVIQHPELHPYASLKLRDTQGRQEYAEYLTKLVNGEPVDTLSELVPQFTQAPEGTYTVDPNHPQLKSVMNPIQQKEELFRSLGYYDEVTDYRREVSLYDAFPECRLHLKIKLLEKPDRIGDTDMLQAGKDNPVCGVRMIVRFLETDEEVPQDHPMWDDILIEGEGPWMTMRGQAGTPVRVLHPKAATDANPPLHWTKRDVVYAMVQTALATRDGFEWFGGVDLHHVAPEALVNLNDGSWAVSYAS